MIYIFIYFIKHPFETDRLRKNKFKKAFILPYSLSRFT